MRTCSSRVTSISALVLVLASYPAAQIAPLVRTGDPIPGVGTVVHIYGVTVSDSGAWMAHVLTDHPSPAADQVVLLNGSIYLREGAPVPGPSETFMPPIPVQGLNAFGDTAWFQKYPLTPKAAVYFNQQLTLSGDNPVLAPEVEPGTRFTNFYDVVLNDARQLLVLADVDEPLVSGSETCVLRVQVDADGVAQSQSVLFKNGDPLPVGGFLSEGKVKLALNESGEAMFNLGPACILLNDTVLAYTAGPAPLFGKVWEKLHARVDLGDQGDYAYTGRVAGVGEVLVWDGIVAARQGEVIDGFAPFALEGFGASPESSPVYVDDQARLVWFADWSDPDTTRDSAIMRDHAILVQEGVSVVEGQALFQLGTDEHRYELSDNGRYLAFSARQADGREGAYLLDMQPGSIYMHAGCSPSPAGISAWGEPVPGGEIELTMSWGQTPLAVAFAGFSPSKSPGGCGIFVPGVGELLIATVPLIVPVPAFVPPFAYTLTLTIPDDPVLIGAEMFVQGLFLDATTPAEPLRLTHQRVELVVGSQ